MIRPISTLLTSTPSTSSLLFSASSSSSFAGTAAPTSQNFSDSSTTMIQPDMEAFSNGFCTVSTEIPCASVSPDSVTGTIPLDLMGTYYKVGPTMFTAGSLPPPANSAVKPKDSKLVLDGEDSNRMVKHPFDADGAMFAITFGQSQPKKDEEGQQGESSDTGVTYRYRYICTVAFDKERKKGTRLYNAMDTTRSMADIGLGNDYPLPLLRHHLQPGLNKQRKNTSNTGVIHWNKKLLSLWDGGLPYKLDSLALSTEGSSQMGGVLKSDTPLSSKYVYDSKNSRVVFYANNPDSAGSKVTIYEFNSRFKLVDGSKTEWKIPGYALLSEGFAVTSDSWNVFIQPPVVVDQLQYMMSKDPGKSLSVDERASATLHLIPRLTTNGGKHKELISLSIPLDTYGPEANSQCINAFEEDGGATVVVDLIRSDRRHIPAGKKYAPKTWPWMKTLEEYSSFSSKKSLWRYRINVKDGTITKLCLSDFQTYFGGVNPAVSGQRHTFIYTAVGRMGSQVAPPQGIMKIDCDSKNTEVG